MSWYSIIKCARLGIWFVWMTPEPRNVFSMATFFPEKSQQHKPKKRFQDSVKDSSSHTETDCNGWETLTTEHAHQRHLIANDVASFESNRVARAVIKSLQEGRTPANYRPSDPEL